MSRRATILVGTGIVILALTYLIVGGVREAAVYYVEPKELKEKGSAAFGKSLRLGGMVVKGSVKWEPRTLWLTFDLTDGGATIPVVHRGSPPDLFGEGRGAVVEGTFTAEGLFKASTILAKHSEEYAPPEPGKPMAARRVYRSLLPPAGTP